MLLAVVKEISSQSGKILKSLQLPRKSKTKPTAALPNCSSRLRSSHATQLASTREHWRSESQPWEECGAAPARKTKALLTPWLHLRTPQRPSRYLPFLSLNAISKVAGTVGSLGELMRGSTKGLNAVLDAESTVNKWDDRWGQRAQGGTKPSRHLSAGDAVAHCPELPCSLRGENSTPRS